MLDDLPMWRIKSACSVGVTEARMWLSSSVCATSSAGSSGCGSAPSTSVTPASASRQGVSSAGSKGKGRAGMRVEGPRRGGGVAASRRPGCARSTGLRAWASAADTTALTRAKIGSSPASSARLRCCTRRAPTGLRRTACQNPRSERAPPPTPAGSGRTGARHSGRGRAAPFGKLTQCAACIGSFNDQSTRTRAPAHTALQLSAVQSIRLGRAAARDVGTPASGSAHPSLSIAALHGSSCSAQLKSPSSKAGTPRLH